MATAVSELLAPIPVQDKVVLVTGASSGIGEAIAKLLAKAGAKVCMGARRTDKLTSVKEAIEKDGGKAYQYDLDVTKREQFANVVKAIEEKVGPIDVLINNAGVLRMTHVYKVMVDDWDKMIEVNCRGVTNGIACVLPGMVSHKRGHIVNISSDAGRKGMPGFTVYCATKYFVEGLCRGLRQEVKDKGIRVTSIQPGACKSELLNHTNDHEALNHYIGGESFTLMDAEDVARSVLYALTQPEHVAVNEILVEPLAKPI